MTIVLSWNEKIHLPRICGKFVGHLKTESLQLKCRMKQRLAVGENARLRRPEILYPVGARRPFAQSRLTGDAVLQGARDVRHEESDEVGETARAGAACRRRRKT